MGRAHVCGSRGFLSLASIPRSHLHGLGAPSPGAYERRTKPLGTSTRSAGGGAQPKSPALQLGRCRPGRHCARGDSESPPRARPPWSAPWEWRVETTDSPAAPFSTRASGRGKSTPDSGLEQSDNSAAFEHGPQNSGEDHSPKTHRIHQIRGSSSRSGGKRGSSSDDAVGHCDRSAGFELGRIFGQYGSSQTQRTRVVSGHGAARGRDRSRGDGVAQPSLTGSFRWASDTGKPQLISHRRESAIGPPKPSLNGRYTSPPWPASE